MLTHWLNFGGTGIASGVRLLGTERYRSPIDVEDYAIQQFTTMSVWYRRTDLTTLNQALLGSQFQVFSGGVFASTAAWAIRAQDWGLDFISVTEGGGFGNSAIGIGWQQPVDQEWHHVLVRMEQWTGAFPGLFHIRMFHDGIDCGLYQTGGPGTYGHANSVYGGYLELGGVYGRSVSPVMTTTPFSGDIAQVWLGTNNNSTFDIRDYYQSGPVNLGADGRSGGVKTLPQPAVYDRIDFPFESTGTFEYPPVMWNMSTRSTRAPVATDAADGISHEQQFGEQAHLAWALGLVANAYNSTTGYQAWYARQFFNGSEYLEYNAIVQDEAVTTTPNWWYRAVLTLSPGRYRMRIQGTVSASNLTAPVTIRMTNYPNNPLQNFQTLGSGTDILSVTLTTPSDSETIDSVIEVEFSQTAYIRFGFDTTSSQPTTGGQLDILLQKYVQ